MVLKKGGWKYIADGGQEEINSFRIKKNKNKKRDGIGLTRWRNVTKRERKVYAVRRGSQRHQSGVG